MKKTTIATITTITAAVCASAALAQTQAITDPQLLDAYAKIREMGPNLTPQVIDGTGRLYAEIHKSSDKGNLEVTRDVHYGPDAKQAMDIYTPQDGGDERPAVVFIHGGGLTGGDKVNPLSDLMNANVATYFGRHGMVGINATYRLVPNITYPEGAEDMQAIVGWIRANAPEYGIDPNKIFFLCSSAGCTHTASLLFNPEVMFDGAPNIAGAIMMSGAYDAGNTDYFGDDAALREQRSTYALADAYTGPRVPLFLLSAEYDPPAIEQGTARLYLQLCEKYNDCPRFAQARDHNHISINQHINSGDDRYTSMMVDFIERVVRGEDE
ncbi:MAG: alpha/beta hydrolase [Pseudomonadales bacterium]|jgi:acetyl esterase/lipase|nr:alpha/beta hydrolase [Pseudomonadales bacterium]